jgi:protein gp37
MADTTGISWTDSTFNPWRGCTKISAGCTNCYAETLSHRNPTVLGVWGDNGTRAIAAESYWRQPLKWNREAEKAGKRRRVFCASLADVFEDRSELDAPRQRLFDLILATPMLDWQLLTKRPEVMADWLVGKSFGGTLANAHEWGAGWPNVWLGVSVENQEQRKRIDTLLSIPAACHWLSMEPLLEAVDIEDYIHVYHGRHPVKKWPYGHIKWVVVGGESGHNARTMQVEWVRDLRRQCEGKAAFFFKQWGEYAPDSGLSMTRVGKKVAGDFIDGRQYHEFPKV